jgi:hypothetical protein
MFVMPISLSFIFSLSWGCIVSSIVHIIFIETKRLEIGTPNE